MPQNTRTVAVLLIKYFYYGNYKYIIKENGVFMNINEAKEILNRNGYILEDNSLDSVDTTGYDIEHSHNIMKRVRNWCMKQKDFIVSDTYGYDFDFTIFTHGHRIFVMNYTDGGTKYDPCHIRVFSKYTVGSNDLTYKEVINSINQLIKKLDKDYPDDNQPVDLESPEPTYDDEI